jgi:hypothetical protein
MAALTNKCDMSTFFLLITLIFIHCWTRNFVNACVRTVHMTACFSEREIINEKNVCVPYIIIYLSS